MTAEDLDTAVAGTLRLLTPVQDRDWTVRAGVLDWDCRTTAAHLAHDLTAYATQLTARGLPPGLEAPVSRAGGGYLPLDLEVRPDAPPRDRRMPTAPATMAGQGARASLSALTAQPAPTETTAMPTDAAMPATRRTGAGWSSGRPAAGCSPGGS
ncbi:hypothetical protein AB0C31_17410 [Actinoplanes philippinensis]